MMEEEFPEKLLAGIEMIERASRDAGGQLLGTIVYSYTDKIGIDHAYIQQIDSDVIDT